MQFLCGTQFEALAKGSCLAGRDRAGVPSFGRSLTLFSVEAPGELSEAPVSTAGDLVCACHPGEEMEVSSLPPLATRCPVGTWALWWSSKL